MIYHLTTNLRQKERENRIKSLDQCKEWPGVGPIDCECWLNTRIGSLEMLFE